MRFTKEYIEERATKKGGYTKKQLALWGVDFPPLKGWKRRLIGKRVPDNDTKVTKKFDF